jgi:competence protein ComGC
MTGDHPVARAERGGIIPTDHFALIRGSSGTSFLAAPADNRASQASRRCPRAGGGASRPHDPCARRSVMKRTRGLTLVELLVVIIVFLIIVALLLPAVSPRRRPAPLMKDQVQIKTIHASLTTFSRDYEGTYPIPSRIHRDLGPDAEKDEIDGTCNTSAAMYSACIMQNYFTPRILVAPTEHSGSVVVKDDYDWSVYSPLDGVFWDAMPNGTPPPGASAHYVPFAVNLATNNPHTGAPVCNVSYAHNPLCGERMSREWRDTLNSKWAVLGNRGVICGDDNNKAVYEASVTLEFHGPRNKWFGNIAYNDNHVELHDTFSPDGLTFLDAGGTGVPDNLFRNDAQNGDCGSGLGIDVFLTLVSDIADDETCVITTEWD